MSRLPRAFIRLCLLAGAILSVASLTRSDTPQPYKAAPVVRMVTTKGTILIKLFPADAPLTVANFEKLIQKHFYDGLIFHRITELSGPGTKIVQGGDPLGNGRGGPGWTIKGEFPTNHVNNTLTHVAGAVAMA